MFLLLHNLQNSYQQEIPQSFCITAGNSVRCLLVSSLNIGQAISKIRPLTRTQFVSFLRSKNIKSHFMKKKNIKMFQKFNLLT